MSLYQAEKSSVCDGRSGAFVMTRQSSSRTAADSRYQHRHFAPGDDALGDSAGDLLEPATVLVAAQEDQVAVMPRCGAEDGVDHWAGLADQLGLQPEPRQVVPGRGELRPGAATELCHADHHRDGVVA